MRFRGRLPLLALLKEAARCGTELWPEQLEKQLHMALRLLQSCGQRSSSSRSQCSACTLLEQTTTTIFTTAPESAAEDPDQDSVLQDGRAREPGVEATNRTGEVEMFGKPQHEAEAAVLVVPCQGGPGGPHQDQV